VRNLDRSKLKAASVARERMSNVLARAIGRFPVARAGYRLTSRRALSISGLGLSAAAV
jgi:hypothetical protein